MSSQVAELVEIDEYIATHHKGKVKPKTAAEKKRWLKERNLKVVKNPRTGKDAIPVADKTVMLSGQRLSATKVREEDHSSKSGAKDSFGRVRGEYEMQVNSKATWLSLLLFGGHSCHWHWNMWSMVLWSHGSVWFYILWSFETFVKEVAFRSQKFHIIWSGFVV